MIRALFVLLLLIGMTVFTVVVMDANLAEHAILAGAR
jgi:hypothetical protein